MDQPILPPINPEMPKSSFPKWPLIAAFTFFLGIVSVLAWQKFLPSGLILVGPSPAAVLPMPSADPTIGWKTFINSNFSFRYPQNLTIRTDALNIDGSIEFNDFIIYIQKTDDTLTDYVNNLIDTNSPKPLAKNIGDLSVIEWLGSYKNAPTHYLSFKNIGVIYSFGVTPLDDITIFEEENSIFLDLILSTFKFTEQIQSPMPLINDMKSYTSPIIGDYLFPFVLRYPLSWAIRVDHKTDEPQALTVVLTKDQDEIKILQGMGDSGTCVYFEDSDYLNFEGQGGYYKSYLQLTQSVPWRLSEIRDDSPNTHSICELSQSRYIGTTRIGWITVKLKNQANLEEVKTILSQISFRPTATTKTIFD